MVTFALEKMQDVQREMEELLPLHWQEIAGDQEIIKLDPDWPSYFAMENTGVVHAMFARSAGIMVGYHISFLRPHLHYRSSFSAITDVYFVHPDFRKGRTGIELFKAVEKSWKARGVQKAFTGCKTYHDLTGIFERMGWVFREKLFVKVL